MNSKRKRILLTLGAALTVASIGIGAVSLAVFTDTETVDATFTSGTIILDGTNIDALILTNTNLVPGDSITGPVVVSNVGTNPLRYSLDTSSTNADSSPVGSELYAALTVDVRTVDVDTVGCGSFDGTQLNGVVPEILGFSNVLFGSVSPTVGTGDRTLASGASETLCIRVELPTATGNAFQDASSVTTFTFNAEQTENN